MYEPNEEEGRRAEALSQAVMSTESTRTGMTESWFEDQTKRIVDRAKEFEKLLKGPVEEDEKSDGSSDYSDENTAKGSPDNFFHAELSRLLNKHSIDNELNTPDFILADEIVRHLDCLFAIMRDRKQFFNSANPNTQTEAGNAFDPRFR